MQGRGYNGTSSMLQTEWGDNATLNSHTDDASSVGVGAIFQSHWACGTRPMCWEPAATNITFMELFPIVLAIKLWGKCIQNQKVIFFCDNQAVVAMINKQSIPQPKLACS